MAVNKLKRRSVKKSVPIVWDWFCFTVSPTVTYEVETGLFFRLAQAVDSRLKSEKIETELTGIVIFPIIANPDIYVREDWVVHKRSDKAYYVGKNVDFEKWMRARFIGRLRLAAENFELSVRAVPERYLPEQTKIQLIEIIRSVAGKLKSKWAA